MNIAHLWTAGAYYVIGLALLFVSIKVWWTHPLNRAFLFGPYLTEEGARQLLSRWPFVFLFGAFILSCAVDHTAEHFTFCGGFSQATLEAIAIVEAVISWFTALCMLALMFRWVWRRVWQVR